MMLWVPFEPMKLTRTPAPFDDERFLFSIKHDGFRANRGY